MRITRLSGVNVIDKNIIIYGYLDIDKKKREICRDILMMGFNGEYTPVIINHILYEVLYELRYNYKLDEDTIETILGGIIYSEKWMKIDYRVSTIEKAREIQGLYGVSTSTALVLATMDEYNLKKIITDRGEFLVYPGVEVLNPFT